MKTVGFVLLALNLSLVGCASRGKPSPAETAPGALPVAPAPKIHVLKALAGTRWTVVELNGASASPAVEGWPAQSLEFDVDGQRLTGHGGVNRFGGRYEEERGRLNFGPLAMTRRAGPRAQMEAEQRYTEVLSRVVGWRQEGANLVLIGPGAVRLALLEPAKKPALE